MNYPDMVRKFRARPPAWGAAGTEYRRGLRGQPSQSARSSIGAAAHRAGLLNKAHPSPLRV